jgi:hypothetical protein
MKSLRLICDTESAIHLPTVDDIVIDSSSPGRVGDRHYNWRCWTEFGSGAIGDIAAHSMNVIFMALDLGPPSAVEVIRTGGMKKELYPEWTVMRYIWPQRGVHPPLCAPRRERQRRRAARVRGCRSLPARARRSRLGWPGDQAEDHE